MAGAWAKHDEENGLGRIGNVGLVQGDVFAFSENE